MKKHKLIYFAVLILIFSGCKKDDNNSIPSNNELIGTWQKVIVDQQLDDGWMINETVTIVFSENTIDFQSSYYEYPIDNPSNVNSSSDILKGNYNIIAPGFLNFDITYAEHNHNGVIDNYMNGSTVTGYYNLQSGVLEWAVDFGQVSTQISGSPNTLQNSSFYNSFKIGDNYTHRKRDFTANSLATYQVQNNSSDMPTEWVIWDGFEIEIHEDYYYKEVYGNQLTIKYMFFENKLYEYWLEDLISLNRQ